MAMSKGCQRREYLLTPWRRVRLEKLTGLQLVKKFPAFHGTRRFITALTSVRHLSILGQPNLVHIPTSHLLEIHPNIIHPSTPRSPQLSPSHRFPPQDPIHPFSPIRATCPAHPRGENTKINYGLDTTSKKNVDGRSTSSHDNKKYRTR